MSASGSAKGSASQAQPMRTFPQPIAPHMEAGLPVLGVENRSLELPPGLMLRVCQEVQKGQKDDNPEVPVPKAIYMPKRPAKLNKNGKETVIGLNTFNVLEYPKNKVFQYDISFSNGGHEKRALIKKIWQSKTVQDKIGEFFLFDGNKIAWSTSLVTGNQKEIAIQVDLDQEAGYKPNPRNTFKVFIAFAKEVSFKVLNNYLASGDIVKHGEPQLIEALHFLDHLMREGPSRRLTQVKKSFFHKNLDRADLGHGVEAIKGCFASMRLANTSLSNGQLGGCLSVNVDVANGTFLSAGPLLDRCVQLAKKTDVNDFIRAFLKDRDSWSTCWMKRAFTPLTHCEVVKQHMADNLLTPAARTKSKIMRIIPKTASQHIFDAPAMDAEGKFIKEYDADGKPVKKTEKMSVKTYFKKRWNKDINDHLPLVELTKKGELVPMEMLTITLHNRFRQKLDEYQTSQMIKFAVTLPSQRWKNIQGAVDMLGWEKDRILNHYGLKINTKRVEVKARILPAPEPTFANSKVSASDASRARWRIDGKKFCNFGIGLQSWGVAIISDGKPGVGEVVVKQFIDKMVTVMSGHGMTVGKDPLIKVYSTQLGANLYSIFHDDVTKACHGTKPTLLVFIVPNRNSEIYLRIKKNCECRFGVASQVMQSAQMPKKQEQYMSNVALKINAKLGGVNSYAVGMLSPLKPMIPNSKIVGPSTCVIGGDVSHPSPGSDGASTAAITVSQDKFFVRYSAVCNTNGRRVEMISDANIEAAFNHTIEHWVEKHAKCPELIMYYRDGVSEGQYSQVILQEVHAMKKYFLAKYQSTPKFTVIIAGKRHHIRFFPKQGDKTGNPLPGTLVELGATHAQDWDFYLCSHQAIKGTARPVHYQVILNEAQVSNEELQAFTFEHSFQYCRSTTPVSLFPAIYYAHLASNRSKAHEPKVVPPPVVPPPVVPAPNIMDLSIEDHERAGSKKSGSKVELPIQALMPVKNDGDSLHLRMWYV